VPIGTSLPYPTPTALRSVVQGDVASAVTYPLAKDIFGEAAPRTNGPHHGSWWSQSRFSHFGL